MWATSIARISAGLEGASDVITRPFAVKCPAVGDDFTGADAKANIVDASDAALVAKGQPLGYEGRGAETTTSLVHGQPDLAADHQLRQFGRVGRGGPAMSDDGAGPHHIDLVGNRHDLAQFVRDQNDRRAARTQCREDTKELIRLLRGQDAGGLVEDQNASATVQCFEDLDPLQRADRQVDDQRFGIDHEAVFALEPPDFLARSRSPMPQQRAALGAEHDVFEHREGVHEHEVLVHHADAEDDRIGGPGDHDGFAVDHDLAAVGLVKPVENAHQGRFASAVLSDDSGNRPRCDAERNVTVHANRDVSLRIAAGSITGIVGENGAGKSTLMSILYGFYEADSGEIMIDGKPVVIARPADAIVLGIGMVHQHFVLVDTFTVLENIMLGAEGGALLRHGAAAAREEVRRLEREYGLVVDPEALVVDLPVGALQRVEILKALYRRARILILDEPTGVLTPQETDQLFRILSALRSSGTTVILITHKLREIMAVTDEVYVMRAGAIVAHRRTAATDPAELAELMVGRKVRLTMDKGSGRFGAPALVAEGLTFRDERGVTRVDNVSFCVRTGEIVAIAGVSGNGQSELLELLAGIRPPTAGHFTANGRVITPEAPSSPAED